MAEIFAINGAGYNGFGQQIGPCPVGWVVTPNGNCGAPPAGCPPEMQLGPNVCRSLPAMKLQNALRSIGRWEQDQQLAAVVVDGIIGSKTARAANHALVTYALKANMRFRTGNLTQAQVANEVDLIASILSAELTRRGGTLLPMPAVRRVPKVSPTPGPVLVPGEEVSVFPQRPRRPAALWGLVGVNAVLAVAGVYLAYIEYGGARRPVMV